MLKGLKIIIKIIVKHIEKRNDAKHDASNHHHYLKWFKSCGNISANNNKKLLRRVIWVKDYYNSILEI